MDSIRGMYAVDYGLVNKKKNATVYPTGYPLEEKRLEVEALKKDASRKF